MRRLLALIVVLAGCGTAVPSPSLVATHSLSPASAMPTGSMTVPPTLPPTPSATPTASLTAAPSPSDELADLDVDVHRIDSPLTAHIETFVSLGDEIVWSGGVSDADNNLYRYEPGAAEPELIYANSERDSTLTSVRGSTAGYVFTDQTIVDGKSRGWRLWFLARGADEPMLLDQSSDDRLPAPTIAMDDHWIAWEAVHGTLGDHLNELFAVSVDDLQHPLVLLSFAGRDAYLQFPSLWGDELWYGIADNDWVAKTEQPRVEMIDLTNPTAAPAVFGADQRAFMPAPARDIVAWKSGGTEDLAASNFGTLTIYARATGDTEELPIPGPASVSERISYPSVGNRFVAWWDEVRSRLYVYDLSLRQFERIAEFDPLGDELVVRPSVSGDLLAWLHYTSDGGRYLEWATLPG